jgi:hypothetical protein
MYDIYEYDKSIFKYKFDVFMMECTDNNKEYLFYLNTLTKKRIHYNVLDNFLKNFHSSFFHGICRFLCINNALYIEDSFYYYKIVK